MGSPWSFEDLDDLFGDYPFDDDGQSPLADELVSSGHASPSGDVTAATSLPALLLPAPPAQVNTYQAPTMGSQLYLPSPPASQPAPAVPVLGQLFLPSRAEVTSVPQSGSVSASLGDSASPESAASPGAGEDGQANGPQKRKNKPRRNWSREETTRLVKGVEKYGIGAWARIQADEEFGLAHRKPWDLKDRFRLLWPNEYGTRDGPIFYKLDVDAALHHKKLNRKKNKKRGGEERPAVPKRAPGSAAVAATTATGRRKVTIRKGTEWSAEEEADLLTAYQTHGKVWRSAAANRGLAFYGRSISDIQRRFSELYPELAGGRPLDPSRSLWGPSDQATAFERGLLNSFGTQGVSRLQAQRISGLVAGPSHTVAPNDGTPGVGGIVHPPAREVGVRPSTYTPEGIVGQDLGFPSPIAALSPVAAEDAAGYRIPTPPILAPEHQLFTPPPPVSAYGHYDQPGQAPNMIPAAPELDANTFPFTEDMVVEMEEFLRDWNPGPDAVDSPAPNLGEVPPLLDYTEEEMMAEMGDYFSDVVPEPETPQSVVSEAFLGPSTDPEVMAAMEEFFGEATGSGWTEEQIMAELDKRFGGDGN
ncbi:hypothetical protein TWF103_010009 [Orbilia oligospora]|nr:hypothetical protein TWF103_010009 [Orbilia oligospora]